MFKKDLIVLDPTCGIPIDKLVDEFVNIHNLTSEINKEATLIGTTIKFYKHSSILESFIVFMLNKKYTFKLSTDSI